METVVRYSARQGSFSANQKLVDIDIPANSGVVDLSSSYVALQVSALITDASAPTTDPGVFPMATHINARDGSGADSATKAFYQEPTAAVLIKNASLSSSIKGKISEIRNVACLRATKALLEKDSAELVDSKNLNGEPRTNQVNSVGNLCELNQGSEKSANRANEIQIPLKEIFNFCKEDAYDTSKLGALRIHLECHLDKLGVSQTYDVASFGLDKNNDAANEKYEDMTPTNYAAGAAGVATPITTLGTYDSLADCPFYNQMKCTINHTTAAGAQAAVVSQITKVVLNNTSKKVEITVDLPFPAGGAAVNATAITLRPVEATAVPVVEKIDLVANYVNESGADSIQYTEYQTLEDNFSSAKTFQRNYHLAPNCINAYVMFPSPIYSVVDQTLGDDNILSYRIAIDNKELTNRRIEMNSPIHHDLLQKAYANMGVPLKNTLATIKARNFRMSDDQNSNHPVSVIAFPIPTAGDGKSKMLTLDLEAADTVPTSAAGAFQLSGKISIYQELVRQI